MHQLVSETSFQTLLVELKIYPGTCSCLFSRFVGLGFFGTFRATASVKSGGNGMPAFYSLPSSRSLCELKYRKCLLKCRKNLLIVRVVEDKHRLLGVAVGSPSLETLGPTLDVVLGSLLWLISLRAEALDRRDLPPQPCYHLVTVNKESSCSCALSSSFYIFQNCFLVSHEKMV